MSIEKIKEIRGHYDQTSNDPIAVICDFLIDQLDTDVPQLVDFENAITPPNESTE
jgi:hypothetical protein